jgi:exodeoxyribonuclease VII large subunit
VPVRAELIGYVDDLGSRQRQATRRLAGSARDRLRAATAGLPRPGDLVATQRQRLDHAAGNLFAGLRHSVQNHRLLFSRLEPRLSPHALRSELRHSQGQLAPLAARLLASIGQTMTNRRTGLQQAGKLLVSLSYRSVLARGYAVIKTPEGALVQQRESLLPGDMVAIEFADGAVEATIAGAPAVKKKSRPPSEDNSQQSLF